MVKKGRKQGNNGKKQARNGEREKKGDFTHKTNISHVSRETEDKNLLGEKHSERENSEMQRGAAGGF